MHPNRRPIHADDGPGKAIDDYNGWLKTLSGKPGSQGALEFGHHRSQHERVALRLDALETPAEATSIRDDYRAGLSAFLRAMDMAMENYRSGGAISALWANDPIRRSNELRQQAVTAFNGLMTRYGVSPAEVS